MKKLFTYLTVTTMALVATTMFMSCEVSYYDDIEDREEARTLEGTWTGYIDTYMYDRFGISGDSYRTTIYFERDNRYGGWGYEVDYNLYSIYDDYYYCPFNWEVVNGEIIIHYADSWNDVYIYDYSLSAYNFSGYMDDGTSSEIRFNLRYDGSFDWGYWTRSFTRSASDHDGVKANGEFAKALNNKKEASN
ncbi:MAG: hypothetical protein E7107_04650 [Prevotella sp.]|jgi:hypothetical protein|nr:hypothetical protein [Prevotella sp.]